MLKKTVTYTDFDGKQHTEDFYFNFTMVELTEMEVADNDSMHAKLQRIIDTSDNEGLIREFKAIIIGAYGERSEDGKRFVKSDDIRKSFEHHAAFEKVFWDIVQSERDAAEFINGVIPPELLKKMTEETPQDKPKGPPPLPKASR